MRFNPFQTDFNPYNAFIYQLNMVCPMSKSERPLSPHLQVYKPQMTTVLSITHRATGAALVLGTFMLVCWLLAAATGEDAFNAVRDFLASPVGGVLLFGWTVSVFYHLCNGIRHLFWDMGYLFKLQNAFRAGWLVLLMTLVLTTLVWCPVFFG